MVSEYHTADGGKTTYGGLGAPSDFGGLGIPADVLGLGSRQKCSQKTGVALGIPVILAFVEAQVHRSVDVVVVVPGTVVVLRVQNALGMSFQALFLGRNLTPTLTGHHHVHWHSYHQSVLMPL